MGPTADSAKDEGSISLHPVFIQFSPGLLVEVEPHLRGRGHL